MIERILSRYITDCILWLAHAALCQVRLLVRGMQRLEYEQWLKPALAAALYLRDEIAEHQSQLRFNYDTSGSFLPPHACISPFPRPSHIGNGTTTQATTA